MDGDNLRHRDTAAPLRMEGGTVGETEGPPHPPPSTTMACCRRRCARMHPGSISNLCSATLGAGALSLPFAISLTGIVFGVLLLVFSAYLTIISIDVIVEACARTQLYKYEDVSVRLVGKGAGRVLEASLLIFCFGTAVAYIVAVGDILDQGLRSISALAESSLMATMYSRERIMVLFWSTVMFPLSLQRNVQSLERFSPLGVLSIIFLVMSAVIHAITHLSDETDTTQSHATTDLSSMMWPSSFWDTVQAFPIFIFAFSCQVNVCAIYEELTPALDHADATNNTDSGVKERTMGRITRNGILLCMSLYVLIGLFGFLDFAESVDDNILNNYCIKSTHDPLMTAASIFVAVAIVVAFPFNILPARVTLKLILERMRRWRRCATCFRFFESVTCGNCLFKWTAGPALQQEEGDATILDASDANASSPVTTPLLEGDRFGDGPHLIPHMSLEGLEKDEELYSSESSTAEHFLLTLLLSGSALIIALLVPGISVVFGLMGGTAASILSFVLPGMFMRNALDEESNHSRRDTLLSNFFVVGGTIVGVLTTATTIYGLFSPGSASETCGSSGSESATPGVR